LNELGLVLIPIAVVLLLRIRQRKR
jgi:hypothetical protein